jgi:hypothetical protein
MYFQIVLLSFFLSQAFSSVPNIFQIVAGAGMHTHDSLNFV